MTAANSKPRMWQQFCTLLKDRSGIAFVEFALMLPIFVGVSMAGIEIAHYVLANSKVQRLATMTADLVAQSGAGEIGVTEEQVYDVFNAIDISAQPFNLRTRGRVVVTAVRGIDPNPSDAVAAVENDILWQRFDGDYTEAAIVLGCHTSTDTAALPGNRTLALNELLFHAQVTYRYEPLFGLDIPGMLSLPTDFTRTAMFRGRSQEFQVPAPLADFPPKSNCSTANGL